MEYSERQYPLFSACGLNCGLCPRFHTNGASRCPGCAGRGFSQKHPACGVLSCCRRRGVAFCFLCEGYPCQKYDGADLSDSFITHKNQLRDAERAREMGIDAYMADMESKARLLARLLEGCDDGRRKSHFCLAVNLLELRDIRDVVEQLAAETKPDGPVKEKAVAAVRLLGEMAERRGVSLHLRKKETR